MGTVGDVKEVKNTTGKLLKSSKKADGTYEFVLRENNPYESFSLDEYLKMLFEACPTTDDGDGDDEAESITEEEKDQLLAQLERRFSAADLADSSEDEGNSDVETTCITVDGGDGSERMTNAEMAQPESRSNDLNADFAESSEREENGVVETTGGDSEAETEQLLTQSEGCSSDVDTNFAESNEQPCSFPGNNGDVETTCITLDDDDDNDTGCFENECRRLSKVQVQVCDCFFCKCSDLSSSLRELSLTSGVDEEVEVISELPPPASTEPDLQVEREIPLVDLTETNAEVEMVDEVDYISLFENEINVVNGK